MIFSVVALFEFYNLYYCNMMQSNVSAAIDINPSDSAPVSPHVHLTTAPQW